MREPTEACEILPESRTARGLANQIRQLQGLVLCIAQAPFAAT